MTVTDTTVMHHAVLLDPFDEVARLAYADALEEAGNLGEADMVRFRVAQWDSFPEGVPAHWNDIDWPGWCGQHNRAGLVESIRCTCDDFMAHAATLFRAHPVTKVTLTDKSPFIRTPSGVDWRWFSYGGAYPNRRTIPIDLFLLLPHQQKKQPPTAPGAAFYPTEIAALEALSQACVTYGRNLAGLPPLHTE